jgi:hypothetical protein
METPCPKAPSITLPAKQMSKTRMFIFVLEYKNCPGYKPVAMYNIKMNSALPGIHSKTLSQNNNKNESNNMKWANFKARI